MSYNHKNIKEIVEMIGRNEIYLPAIQRKFVWGFEQIESLFDSIMRGYPIGTFLFWFVQGENKDEYTFYKFLQDYHERDRYLNDIAPKPELKEEIIGILDGQQRISSIYIALQGKYSYKKPYARWDNDSAFPEREFYLNLLKKESADEENGIMYEFKFLTRTEAKKTDRKHLWFLVKKAIKWGDDPEIDEYYDDLIETNLSDQLLKHIKAKRKRIKKILRILHQRLAIEKLISYYKITEQELDNILDIFVRVNSGGTILSKSDLLFSTIVANWEQGRDEIEKFLLRVNNKGDGFWFNNDFIMRSCLVLTDCSVLFKVNSFKKANIKKIKAQWKNIKSSIIKAVDQLVEFGFNGETLTSQNAVIPIAYYFIKGGRKTAKSKKDIRKYLIHSLLKKIYGGQGDQVLSSMREILTQEDNDGNTVLIQNEFDFSLFLKGRLPGKRSIKITEEDIDEILEFKKGSYSFMVLSLLYPQLKFNQIKFHQDHIHPASMFSDAKLKKNKVRPEEWKIWQEMKDKLPNLQLMEGSENESKNRTPFYDWINGTDSDGDSTVVDISKYKRDNYIPKNASLHFNDFKAFFKKREKLLKKKLIQKLQ